MDQGFAIVLPLFFFFLFDLTIFVNSLRQGANSGSARSFTLLAGVVMLSQGLTAVTYACDFKLISLNTACQYIFNYISLSCMTMAPYIWFEHLLLSDKDIKPSLLTRKWRIIFFIPVLVQLLAGIPSQWTHWLFYINENGVYQPGTMFFLQFAGFVYYAAAVVLAVIQIKRGQPVTAVIYRIGIYILPMIIGTVINNAVYRGGYTQIGCSYSVFLLYLEQYITEVNENKRLKSLDVLNRRLEDQFNIVGGLANAYFSAYSADLNTGTCKAIKVIDPFQQMVRDCDSTEFVTASFIKGCVMPEDQEKMREFTDQRTLADRLDESDTAVQEFHGAIPPWEWCRASWIVAARDENGKAVKVLFALEDISSIAAGIRQREQERDQEHMLAEMRLQTMTEAIHGGFKLSKNDRPFTFKLVSVQLADMLGYDSPDDLIAASGGTMRGIVHPADAEREIPQATVSIRAGKMYTMHYRMRCKDGSWKNVEDRGRLIRKPDGDDEFWSFIVDQDELTRKSEALEAATLANAALEQAQQELKVARDQADAANKAKTSFLFNMSHDIRTPLNAIVGYTELIQKNYSDRGKCENYIQKIRSSSDFLISLVNNVLEMARIESGKVVLDEAPTVVGQITGEMMAVYEEAMKKKNLEFIRRDDYTTHYVYCDQLKIKEIILNLISNAYKYTPSGGKVFLTTEELPCEREGYVRLRTSVTDTGIGISSDYLPKLFDEFSRERSSIGNKIEGTGLGMSIVKKLIDLMGGTIEVESRLGEGSRFTVTLTHRVANAEDIRSGTPADVSTELLAGRRILLAEDNDLNAEIAIEILKEYGVEIERAADGVICVDMLQKAESGYYDLILMDVLMPNMNGYEATRRIREIADPDKKNIPIIAMTANAFEEDKRNALDAGMDGHLAKPINVPKLLETLSGILAR